MEQVVKRKKARFHKREEIAGTIFASIPVLGFVIFGLGPMILAVVMSFMEIKGYSFDISRFIGIRNYQEILTDPKFGKSLLRTLYAAVSMPVNLALGLIIAQLMNRNAWGTKVFRVIFFLPFVCSVVATTTMWKWMYDEQFGILNSILVQWGLERIPWITDGDWFMPSMLIMNIWGGTGFSIILFSASLGNVSRSYYEAAKIDGAGRVRTFFNITVPCITPTMFFLVTTGLIGAMQAFASFQVMGGDAGGPNEAGLTAVFYLWRMGFKNVITEGMGKASSVALVLAVIIVFITIINFFVSKWWVHDES